MSFNMRLAVYEPDIAQNLGTMIRLGACLGIPVDVIEPCGFPFSVKALRRSAMDYAELGEIRHHDSWEAYRPTAPGRIVLLTTRATQAVWDFRFRETDTVLVGRESAGVPEQVHRIVDAAILIPMPGGGRSLNVAVAAALTLGEAVRQCRPAGQTDAGAP